MTMRLLWFVLAGFLLGFSASTLWEWLHFRRERMKLRDERVQSLEGQLAVEQELNAQLRMMQNSPPPLVQPEYSSPGVFLDSETPTTAEFVAPVERRVVSEPPELQERQDSTDPVPVSVYQPKKPQEVPRTTQTSNDREFEVAAFEVKYDDDASLLGRLAAELVREPDDVPEVEEPLPHHPVTPRSRDFPDNLSKIKGIGDVYKFRLYNAGIFTWHQVAESDIETLRVATNAYPGSNVEEWPQQARELAKKNGRQNAYYTGPIPDDLTKIVGIGPVGERTLYRAGICTYDQLAGATVGELHELFPIAIAGDQPDFDQWIRMAIEFANRKGGE